MAQCSSLPVVPFALLIFGLVAILLLTVPTEDVREAPGFTYGIVLDAGSSHTDMYIYKWPADKQNGTGVVTQHSECHVKGGGISSYVGQKGAAGRSLEACLDQAVRDIPKERHLNTPVYLGATAGMRILQISDPQQSDQILEEVGQKIQSYPFNYQGAAILSGQEEGAYGWVTVNYVLENFIKSQLYSQAVTHPCYPADYSKTLKMGKLFNSPCVLQHKPVPFNPEVILTVRGGGNYEYCVGNVSGIFSFGSCAHSRCSFNGVFQPEITGRFMAFSAFFYIHTFLQQITGITVNSPQQLEDAAKTVCSKTFSQMMLLAPKEESRIQDYCASSVFMRTLILKGYGFDNSSFPLISFQKKAGDTSVGWALGYMLSLSNLLPAESVAVRKALTLGAWGTLVFLTVVLLVVILAFLLLRSRCGTTKRRDESAI
ncbi:ectonucleoside triphosphate diphosphohydrolase 2 isoform X3 [Nothobranchius furzeri]|uniref:ectonucleoside triphosphate diphosphohydrolase 2 isoform X3 n=1 Tax=Nothobranchius furzeri TaxID=105023 RepID=UPI0039047360